MDPGRDLDRRGPPPSISPACRVPRTEPATEQDATVPRSFRPMRDNPSRKRSSHNPSPLPVASRGPWQAFEALSLMETRTVSSKPCVSHCPFTRPMLAWEADHGRCGVIPDWAASEGLVPEPSQGNPRGAGGQVERPSGESRSCVPRPSRRRHARGDRSPEVLSVLNHAAWEAPQVESPMSDEPQEDNPRICLETYGGRLPPRPFLQQNTELVAWLLRNPERKLLAELPPPSRVPSRGQKGRESPSGMKFETGLIRASSVVEQGWADSLLKLYP